MSLALANVTTIGDSTHISSLLGLTKKGLQWVGLIVVQGRLLFKRVVKPGSWASHTSIVALIIRTAAWLVILMHLGHQPVAVFVLCLWSQACYAFLSVIDIFRHGQARGVAGTMWIVDINVILKVAVPIENLDEYVLGAGQCPFWVRGMRITIALKISWHNVAEVPLDALIYY